jgi:outer membrane immunogenic protein
MCLGIVGPALGADLPQPPPSYTPPPPAQPPPPALIYNWTGFYVGVNAGYGWGAWDGHQIYTQQLPLVPFGPFDTSSHTISGNGALAGGQIGYNYQFGNFVAGIEGDGSWAHLTGDTTLFPYPSDPHRGTVAGTPAWGFGIENNWLATVRGRIGVTTGSLLFYGTGGAAFGGFHETHTVLGYGYSDDALSTRDEIKVGWTAGAGIEWALTNNWSAKAEYLFTSFPGVGGVMQWALRDGHRWLPGRLERSDRALGAKLQTLLTLIGQGHKSALARSFLMTPRCVTTSVWVKRHAAVLADRACERHRAPA